MTIRLPQGYGLITFDEIDSTNEEAKRLAHAGELGPVWILAKRQTAGRGRRGRSWASLEGNLLTTLLIRPGVSAAEAGRLSFVAALSVYDLAAALCPDASVGLKWPNDIRIAGKKCAGILLEGEGGERDAMGWLAVGIGVNLKHAPENTPYPAAALAEYGARANADDSLATLAHAWAHWYGLWQSQGFRPIREAWLSRADGVGNPIVAQLGDTTLLGIFTGLDDQGRLILTAPDATTHAISAGEVFFDVRAALER
ncbi:MAG TPA: biotin--[acetyl-CoA-carboxylase] ligase [Alphaproteobacteria bacterium]|nr:biotin--[acetyl-CoA-carboxylase] ligase [Alphaproteobacteria bacterium]HAJ46571.1 biotin--[acetyl-CoA-carboxylase] ligase [Alphaproteobacteria bacterium]